MKLSELYAGFLIAIGGVSITVLSIVSAVGAGRKQSQEQLIINSFLSAALIVATVSCFIGAHMMAETAAFIKYFKEKLPEAQPPKVHNTPTWNAQEWTPPQSLIFGKRLFLLASTNIFIAVMLVLFALVLLPAARVGADGSLPGSLFGSLGIYFVIFVLVGAGALRWMFLASKHRMPLPKDKSKQAIKRTSIGAALWVFLISTLTFVPRFTDRFLPLSIEGFLMLTFIPGVLGTGGSLLYFANIFKGSDEAHSDEAHIDAGRKQVRFKFGYEYLSPEVTLRDTVFFGVAVTASFASLVIAGINILTKGIK